MNSGKLIVIEGIDGSGKSTNCAMLSKELQKRNIKNIYTFEPTYGTYGSKLRESFTKENLNPYEELDLFVKDRQEHLEKEIKPALEQGYIVILDRYYYSSVAYQGAKGVDPNHILSLHKDFIIIPDLVFIFHLPVEIALQRIMSKRGFVDRFESYDYLKTVDELFYSFEAPYIHHINANDDINTINNTLLSKILALPLPQ